MEIAEGAALVRFPGQWALLVEHGRDVTVEWEGDGDLPAWIVDSWAVNLAMLQRGHLCLHATVVEVGGRVLALGGASGAGKSTTAAALHLRGHPVLVDDVAVIDLRRGVPWVLPYRRVALLTEDTLDALGPGLDVGPIERLSGKATWSPLRGARDARRRATRAASWSSSGSPTAPRSRARWCVALPASRS